MDKRAIHLDATVCYLKSNNKILMLKFSKKWNRVYAPPGGKFQPGESPLDCITREFREETGLTLINPKLQGISYWCGSAEGVIFVFVAEKYEGTQIAHSPEGKLAWIGLDDLQAIKQFEQNKLFTPYLFKDGLFEGKFLFDDDSKLKEYTIRIIS